MVRPMQYCHMSFIPPCPPLLRILIVQEYEVNNNRFYANYHQLFLNVHSHTCGPHILSNVEFLRCLSIMGQDCALYRQPAC